MVHSWYNYNDDEGAVARKTGNIEVRLVNGNSTANFITSSTGTIVGVLGAGWKYSSNASQWSSANKIAKSLEDTGIKVSTSVIKNGISNGLKTTGKVLGGVGVVFTTIDALSDGNITLGEGAKIGIGLVTTLSPVGWVYGVADIGFQVISGTSLTDRGNAIDNY